MNINNIDHSIWVSYTIYIIRFLHIVICTFWRRLLSHIYNSYLEYLFQACGEVRPENGRQTCEDSQEIHDARQLPRVQMWTTWLRQEVNEAITAKMST